MTGGGLSASIARFRKHSSGGRAPDERAPEDPVREVPLPNFVP
jgi:hypothetical protein